MTTDNIFYRSFGLDRASVDEKKRTVDLVFSTETPVDRWGEAEILLHGPKNVDLSRLKMSGSGLFNHNPDKIIGPISKISIKDFRGVLTLGFDDDEIGNMAFGKVNSGSLRGVSVGYEINDAISVPIGSSHEVRVGLKIKGPAFVATRWTPGEITLTPVPADPNSGVGRSRSLSGINITEIREPVNPRLVTKRSIEYLQYQTLMEE